MKSQTQLIQIHRFLEWCLIALCTASLFTYLLHSLAAEKYTALYLALLKKLPMLLGN